MEQAVYHLDSLRARRAQRASHAMAGLGMLLIGLEALSGDTTAEFQKGILEVTAGGLLFVAVIYESFQAKRQHRHSVEWADFFAALVAVVEGVTKIHASGFWNSHLSQLWFLVAALFVLKGIYVSKLPKWSRVVLSEKSMTFRRSLFRKRVFSWDEVKDIQITNELLLIEQRSGQIVRYKLIDYAHPEMIATWCREQIPKFRGASTFPLLLHKNSGY